jgi:hypothetical protein
MGLSHRRNGKYSKDTLAEAVMGIVKLEGIEPELTGAVSLPQTPSEWLLARYDRELRRAFGPQGDVRRIRRDRGTNFDRRIFDVIDDHPGASCQPVRCGNCAFGSSEASWPAASVGEDLHVHEVVAEFDQTA